MRTIKLTNEEYLELQKILDTTQDEHAQDKESVDYQEDYAKIMKNIYLKFEVVSNAPTTPINPNGEVER